MPPRTRRRIVSTSSFKVPPLASLGEGEFMFKIHYPDCPFADGKIVTELSTPLVVLIEE